jgi:hypothetical protein
MLTALMLGDYSTSASSTPSAFSMSLQPPGSLLPIDRHSTSLHFRYYKQVGSKLAMFSFFFGPLCMLFDLSIALLLPYDLSPKVAVPTHRSGACETWVPVDPHQPDT